MNLDRFAVGLADPQAAREVGECENCGGEIYEGEQVVRYDGDLFCDTTCLSEYLLQNALYEEVVV
ncbi:hypothetical protein JOC94_004201 [Bacillus thermophilus]|uniref:TRASH domain-containing protein n=1 Tax=Siminovitchia thermophila TaxID=1245522 RepID=A0ABS2RBZ2_9BACI|nr:hypothetical protein [Siminovitchia thermophila]MBM7717176.1 hypothetical protein [Siminovitchia thermophila]